MLYIVLVLVLAALGLLVAALITAHSLWAWISIGLSVLAGAILVMDWLGRRSRGAAGPAGKVGSEKAAEDEDRAAERPEGGGPFEAAERTALLPAMGVLDPAANAVVVLDTADAAYDDGDEKAGISSARITKEPGPGEEQTDAVDLQVVSELDVEVVVVDEYPRYHVTECIWLADRDMIPIAVSEARQLGFTPCVRCGPDAKLARLHRAKRKSGAGR